jgi:hypothetical protein
MDRKGVRRQRDVRPVILPAVMPRHAIAGDRVR